MISANKQRINLSLDKTVIAELEKMSEKQGVSISALVNSVLKAGLDSTNALVDALDGMSIPALLEVLIKDGKKKKK